MQWACGLPGLGFGLGRTLVPSLRSPSRLRSSGHAFQRFLRRSARLHTVTKTTAARAVARAQAERERRRANMPGRAARAMGAPLRRRAPTVGAARRASAVAMAFQTCLLALLEDFDELFVHDFL